MEKDNLIVGRVKMNPVDNEMCPCIKIIMSEGLGHDELVLLKVVNSGFEHKSEEIN